MEDTTISHDISFWNVDGLDLRTQAVGQATPLPLDPTMGMIGDLCYLSSGQVLVSRPEAQRLQVVDFRSRSARTIYRWRGLAAAIPFTVTGRTMFVFDPDASEIVGMTVDSGTCRVLRTWAVQNAAAVARASSICVRQSGTDAYIVSDVRVFFLNLTSQVCLPTPLDLDSAVLSNSHIKMYLDERSSALVVSDPENDSVLEVDIPSGTTRTLWPVGQPSTVERHAGISRPSAAITYYPHDQIDRSYLTHDSRRILDVSRVLPRTLLVADTQNCRVLKRVDFPDTPRLLGLQGKSLFSSLLGSGHTPPDLKQELATAPTDDLRSWAIGRPNSISIGPAGELLVSLQDFCTLLLLEPATAVLAKAAHKQTQEHEYDTT
jgi:hypothetical protein